MQLIIFTLMKNKQSFINEHFSSLFVHFLEQEKLDLQETFLS